MLHTHISELTSHLRCINLTNNSDNNLHSHTHTHTHTHTHGRARRPARPHARTEQIIVSGAYGGTLWKLLGRSY